MEWRYLVEAGKGVEVSVDEVHHGLDDGVALVSLHIGHHAEVQITELALGRGQQVTRVGIRVEEAVLEHLAEGALHERVH